MPLDVKICGLTNYDDAMVAIEAGADFLGFVLFPKSPRYIRPLELVRLLDRLPPGTQAVAVCVNLPRTELDGLLADAPVARVQFHGDEQAADAADLAVPFWRSLSLRDGELQPDPTLWLSVDHSAPSLALPRSGGGNGAGDRDGPVGIGAERFVLDAAAPGRYGGTGEKTDWDLAAREASRLPLMLAGGLTPANVAEAIRRVQPAGVDTSSGVERVPGRKDWDAVKQFVREARQALAENTE